MVDKQKLQISELHHDKCPTPTLSCWKKRFQTEVCACSGSPSEAMLWIKEVEMVDSVDELSHHALFEDVVSRMLNCWMRILRQP